jgi:DNA-binding CsgD family transcriptional regulator
VHLLAIFRVLGVRNRTEAVIAAQRQTGSIGAK